MWIFPCVRLASNRGLGLVIRLAVLKQPQPGFDFLNQLCLSVSTSQFNGLLRRGDGVIEPANGCVGSCQSVNGSQVLDDR